MMRTILVTATNQPYFPLAQDLFNSIFYHQVVLPDLDLGCLIQDLAPEALAWLNSQGIRCQPLNGDLAVRNQSPSGPAISPLQIAKTCLPEYFPDYDLILWLDADTWVQDPQVISAYLDLAQRGQLVITPELHRAYVSHYDPEFARIPFRLSQNLHGLEAAARLSYYPPLNTGAFALACQSGHWLLWQKTLTQYLQVSQHPLLEQLALNYLVYSQVVEAPQVLPSYCNYNTYLALPIYDPQTQIFFEPPSSPWQKIWLMHLTGPEKTKAYRLKTLTGGEVEQTLRFQVPRKS